MCACLSTTNALAVSNASISRRSANAPKAVVSSCHRKNVRRSDRLGFWRSKSHALCIQSRSRFPQIGRSLAVTAAAEGNEAGTSDSEIAANSPINAPEAIEWGQESFSKGDYQRALELFREVFTLPGSGSMRYAGTVKEISCASTGEENAALYNIACCYARLGTPKEGLEALKTCLENGFEDYENIKADSDLEPIRQLPEFNGMFGKYDNILTKMRGKKNSNKKWFERW